MTTNLKEPALPQDRDLIDQDLIEKLAPQYEVRADLAQDLYRLVMEKHTAPEMPAEKRALEEDVVKLLENAMRQTTQAEEPEQAPGAEQTE